MIRCIRRFAFILLSLSICIVCYAADDRRIDVKVAPIVVAPVTSRVSTFGTLSPNTEDLSFKIGGRIARFVVEQGEEVLKGQLLAELETQDARDDVSKQKVLLEQAKRSYSRMEQLHSKGSIQQSQLEDSADKLEQVRIAYDKATLNLTRCSLLAPENGLILKEYQDSRTTVAAGSSIFSFQGSGEAWVTKVELTDRNAFALGEGASARVQFTPFPGVKFAGVLTQLARVANATDGLYTAELTISSHGHELRPGMVAEVDLYRQSAASYAQFPLDALVEVRGSSGSAFFLNPDSDTVSKIKVTIHSLLADQVAIEGAAEGFSMVVTRGQRKLENGAAVSIVK